MNASVYVQVRRVRTSRGPRLGNAPAVEVDTFTVATIDGGHFDPYTCPRCGVALMTRARPSSVRQHGGPACPSCPLSGVVMLRAAETVIPGFDAGSQGVDSGKPKRASRSMRKHRRKERQKSDAEARAAAREHARAYRTRKKAERGKAA
jgi:hypothetical protein